MKKLKISPNPAAEETIIQGLIVHGGLDFTMTDNYEGKVIVRNCIFYCELTRWERFKRWAQDIRVTTKYGTWRRGR